MKPVFYFGRFWIGWYPMPLARLPWFSVSRPGRGVYVQILKVCLAWA